jgi:hypothetical protein
MVVVMMMTWQEFICDLCHAMVQAVSCYALVAEAQVCTQVSLCGIYGGQSGTGTGFSLSSLVFPSLLFHHSSPYSFFTWGMNNRPIVGSRSSETLSRTIDMNNNNNNIYEVL